MKIYFEKLILHCRKSEEIVDISHQISYFHGRISAGKSSIVRLIDYCLGGDVEKTPAISQEMVSVQLLATIGTNNVLFERNIDETTSVQVTWSDSQQESATVLAPLGASQEPIWQKDIYNLSDLIFYLAGIKPIKVRRSKEDYDSQLVRLSFRDVMWYCYLEQDNLDSSFYNLTDQFKRLKSRDVMRFVTGLYTEKINDLEIKLDGLKSERSAKIESIRQIRIFLKDFGYDSEEDVSQEIFRVETELSQAQQELLTLRNGFSDNTHFADSLRERLREFTEKISIEEEVNQDLERMISEQGALKAELLSAKFKLARSVSASSLLSGVKFDICPACGSKLEATQNIRDCYLCGHEIELNREDVTTQAEVMRSDLNSRIDDLTESIKQHKLSQAKQQNEELELKRQKAQLDSDLAKELTNYDSVYLSNSREAERLVATLIERKRNLEKISKMPEAISAMEKETDQLKASIEETRREIETEKGKLTGAQERIKDIELAYMDALNNAGVPGIEDGDRVAIDPRNWIPQIVPPDGDAYNFFNAGSGGKKTLLNVCYALAIHRVAMENNLPLPTFLMIDTPMKNIGEDVNEDIFQAFYNYLYQLASGPLAKTQIIIIDKEYFAPSKAMDIDIQEKFMSPDQPLISYYRGP